MTQIVDRLKSEFCDVLRVLIECKGTLAEPTDAAFWEGILWLRGLRSKVEDTKKEITNTKPAYSELDAFHADLEALDELWRNIASVSPVHGQTEKDSKDQGDMMESLFKSDCSGNERPLPEPAGEPAPMMGDNAERAPESSQDIVVEPGPVVGDKVEARAKPKPAEVRQKRLPVTQKVAAKLCGVTEKQIGKWDKGVQRPDRYPGRYDLAVLVAWAETYKQTKLVASAARAANHPSTAEDRMLENLSDEGSGDPAALYEQNQNRKTKL